MWLTSPGWRHLSQELYDAGVKRKGTDVPKWISIMTERTVCHLQKVFERYKSYSPYDMLESIKKEVKGDLENAFLNLGEQGWPFLAGREGRDRRSE